MSTSIYLPDPLVRRVDELAQREDRSRSYVVSRAVEEWCDRAIADGKASENQHGGRTAPDERKARR